MPPLYSSSTRSSREKSTIEKKERQHCYYFRHHGQPQSPIHVQTGLRLSHPSCWVRGEWALLPDMCSVRLQIANYGEGVSNVPDTVALF
jgi:hypothetical protein